MVVGHQRPPLGGNGRECRRHVVVEALELGEVVGDARIDDGRIDA